MDNKDVQKEFAIAANRLMRSQGLSQAAVLPENGEAFVAITQVDGEHERPDILSFRFMDNILRPPTRQHITLHLTVDQIEIREKDQNQRKHADFDSTAEEIVDPPALPAPQRQLTTGEKND
jgi:hypothetical protein